MLKWMNRRALRGRIERELQALTSGNHASLPVIDACAHGYRPVGGERLLCLHDGLDRVEWASTGRYDYGGVSVTVPIGGGMRVRMGSGQIASQKGWRKTGIGRLLVTDKALVFESDSRNERWTWAQVANVEICENGYGIHRRRGKPVLLQWRYPIPSVCAIIDVMLRRVG